MNDTNNSSFSKFIRTHSRSAAKLRFIINGAKGLKDQGICSTNKHKTSITIFILLLALIEIIKTAWIGDDAAITLRSVLNFLHGYGPNYNIDERVQSFTHPTWFFLISVISLFTKNVFVSTFLISIAISLLVLWLIITKVAISFWNGILAVSILLLSKAYVDYSTSGLENPLSHLLLIILFLSGLNAFNQPTIYSSRRFFFIAALLYLTHPDLILISLPFSMYLFFKNGFSLKFFFQAVLVGYMPLIIWTLFSLYYYGFLFPNTAYAKLDTGIAHFQYILQGFNYVLDSFVNDPITLSVILLTSIVGFFCSRYAAFIILGEWLYLSYVVFIGGDFMSGRFFTAPLLVSTVLLANCIVSKIELKIMAIIILVLGVIHLNNTLLSPLNYRNKIIINGIADERGYYFQNYGLLTAEKKTFFMQPWALRKPRTIVAGVIGYLGILAGPGTHIIDYLGLSDPLLSRMPSIDPKVWRIGHFIRPIPSGYIKSVQKNTNEITSPSIRNYYEIIRLITRGSINDPKRFQEILKINIGLIRYPAHN